MARSETRSPESRNSSRIRLTVRLFAGCADQTPVRARRRERRNGIQNRALVTALSIVSVAAIAGGGFALAADTDGPRYTHAQVADATKAALKATGGGEVKHVEAESDHTKGAVFEVEVDKRDGTTYDVHLDNEYAVVVVEDETVPPDDDDN